VLSCGKQALFVLVWFRKREDSRCRVPDSVSAGRPPTAITTRPSGWLAEQAPDLHEALEQAKENGLAYTIVDDKVFSADRCLEKTTSAKGEQVDLWYSGKAQRR
jgi:hypothetical protein